jgi:peptidoglycan/LPS O-acetylase OafA/YrhL
VNVIVTRREIDPPHSRARLQSGRLSYRPDIDSLRAVAILPVVLYHAGIPGFSGGFVGVDVFFVISGYLMASLIIGEIDRGEFSLLRFYERRIRRIFPALFAMVAGSSVMAWLVFMPVEFEYFAHSVRATALFISNIRFEKESGYFDMSAQLKPLLHTWSLAVEEQFYIVFPVALTLLAKVDRRRTPWVLLFLLVASLAASAWYVHRAPVAAFYLSQFRGWELLLGALLAFDVLPRSTRPVICECLAGLGIVLIGYAVLTYSNSTVFPGLAALVPCLGAALVIHGAATEGPAGLLLRARPVAFVGLISYSLYLWHWPLIVFTRYFTGHILSPMQGVLLVVASLVAAVVSWRFIEQPFRGPASRIARLPLFAVATTVIVAAVLFGGYVTNQQGLPGRLPAAAREAYSATYDLSRFSSSDCSIDTNGSGPSLADVRAGKLCQLGAAGNGPINFIVWGDSHSGAMAPAIDKAAADVGMRGLLTGHASCPPLPDVVLSRRNDADTAQCASYNAAVRDLIAEKHIPVVFMVAYWPKYVHDAELPNEGLYFDPSVPPPVEDHSTFIKTALDNTLAELKQQGKQTVLVMDVPEMGRFVPEALAKALMTGTTTDIAPPWSYVAARQALSRSILATSAATYGATVVDPLPTICANEHCDAERNGTALYKDADHITATMARSISYLYAPLFKSLGATGPSTGG